jgi:hypothetical protein
MRRQRSFLRVLFSQEDFLGGLLFFAVGSVFFLLAFGPDLLNAKRLSADGFDTFANVMALEVDDAGEKARYLVQAAFLVDGEWSETTSATSRAFFDTLQVEDRIPVRYWSRNPEIVEVEPGSIQLRQHEAILGFGTLLLILAATSILPFRQTVRVIWLSRYGVPMQTEVTGHADGSSPDGPPRWKATWIEPDGGTGSTRALPGDKVPEIGSLITVLTDPTGKRESLWEGDL